MAQRLNVALEPTAGPRPHVVLPSIALRSRKNADPDFHIKRECAGLTDDDLRVGVPSDQRRSGQVGTESCGPGGDVRIEA